MRRAGRHAGWGGPLRALGALPARARLWPIAPPRECKRRSPRRRTSSLGAQTREVLGEIGFGDEEIAALARDRIIACAE